MHIPIDCFERYVDEIIIKRALSYYENGNVIDVEEKRPEEFEAIVEGTEDYTVQLKLEDGKITEYDCDCPYDMGPVCKHVVAVIMYLQENDPDVNPGANNAEESISPLTGIHETNKDRVNEILEKVHPEELKQFIRKTTAENSNFKNLFLSSFEQANSQKSKEFYKQVQEKKQMK